MAWLSGWDKRLEITVSNTNIDSDLTHFATLLKLSTSSGTGSKDISCVFDELTADANRFKIAVTKSDGTTEIYAEIEKWDDANEIAWLWASKSDLVLSASGTTTLYLYYDVDHADNTTYIADIGARTEVWRTAARGVFHMADLTTSTIEDSTSNSNDGTKKGAGEPAVITTGQIANAQDFDGANDYINLLSPADFSFGDGTDDVAFSVRAWVKYRDYGIGASEGWICKFPDNTANREYALFTSSGSNIFWRLIDPSASNAYIQVATDNSYAADDDVWVLWHATYDGSSAASGLKIYRNGVAVDITTGISGTYVAMTDLTGNLELGRYDEKDTRAANMDMDEARIYAEELSAALAKADYYNETDGLVSWSGEQRMFIPQIIMF